MDVAARRRLGRVGIAMGIEPDQAERFALAGVEVRGAGHRADGDAVIAPQHQWHTALGEALVHGLHEVLARRQDGLLVAQLAGADLLGLGDHDVQVAVVLDLVPQLLQALLEVRDPDRGGAHVDPAATCAEVDGHADHTDTALLLGHEPKLALGVGGHQPAPGRCMVPGTASSKHLLPCLELKGKCPWDRFGLLASTPRQRLTHGADRQQEDPKRAAGGARESQAKAMQNKQLSQSFQLERCAGARRATWLCRLTRGRENQHLRGTGFPAAAALGSGTVSIPGSVSSSMLSVIHAVEPGAAVAVWRMREDPAPADDYAAKPRGLAEIRRTFAELGDPAWDRYPRWNLRPAC